ncbi:hypothetical protein STHAL_03855 [Streptomyces halstedii]|uniref:Uncharacterized protein n=1 Tax=Streptomyces halstedii TaxID=1944 RepID=A0ABS6TKB0_STRHA|nr:hypothetical protein [Streptomyces halstedii]MBV7668637.1 hypothetical protein [Streptomyces halstedii]
MREDSSVQGDFVVKLARTQRAGTNRAARPFLNLLDDSPDDASGGAKARDVGAVELATLLDYATWGGSGLGLFSDAL